MDITKNLRKLRTQKKLSQAEVSKAMVLSRTMRTPIGSLAKRHQT